MTLSAAKEPSKPLPADWLLPRTEGHRLRFIASNYRDDEALLHELIARFGAVRIECEPMPLRAIANALMQARRGARGLTP